MSRQIIYPDGTIINKKDVVWVEKLVTDKSNDSCPNCGYEHSVTTNMYDSLWSVPQYDPKGKKFWCCDEVKSHVHKLCYYKCKHRWRKLEGF